MQWHRHGADIADERFVDGKPGTRVDDFIARIAIDLLGKPDGRLGTREDDDTIRSDRQSACRTHAPSHSNAKRFQALRVAVVRLIEIDLALYLVGDMRRQGEVRL